MNKIEIATWYLKTASQEPTKGFIVLAIEVEELGNSVVYKAAFEEEKELEVGTFLTPRQLRLLEADLALLADFSGIEVAIVR
jgi:hypothetical protein